MILLKNTRDLGSATSSVARLGLYCRNVGILPHH